MSQPEQRHVIRPEHFQVSPQMIGMNLASPSRRLAALLIDLLLVAILARAGGGFLLALAAAWAFLSFAGRPRVVGETGQVSGRKRKWILRGAGAFMLFVAVQIAWEGAKSTGAKLAVMATGATPVATAATEDDVPGEDPEDRGPSAAGVLAMGAGAIRLKGAETREEAAEAATQLVTSLRASGAEEEAVRDALESIASESDRPWMPEVVSAALQTDSTARLTAPAESLALWHAAAITARDTLRADSLRPLLASALARDSLDQLRHEVSELQGDREQLRRRADAAENRGMLARVFQLLDELGIGFGWTGLYFTVLTTLWKGQTIGKRLLGVRVLRLNGEPMTLWLSFERFGGYAAGLFTGLLGFAQVIWDRNRQAIHDKITETVVVRELRAPPPAPAPPSYTRPVYRAPS
jgi:hypothetical protein